MLRSYAAVELVWLTERPWESRLAASNCVCVGWRWSFFSGCFGGARQPTPFGLPCELAPDEEERAVLASSGGRAPSMVRGSGLCMRWNCRLSCRNTWYKISS